MKNMKLSFLNASQLIIMYSKFKFILVFIYSNVQKFGGSMNN